MSESKERFVLKIKFSPKISCSKKKKFLAHNSFLRGLIIPHYKLCCEELTSSVSLKYRE